MTRYRHEVGDGDACPIIPAHGRMLTISGSDPAKQWCPAQMHDGNGDKASSSPNIWPLYGFEAAVAEYYKGVEREAHKLPDLSGLEV